MLELRPNCECCDKDLPPDSREAMICSFECTFCASCAGTVLGGRCPNCGGGFAPRRSGRRRRWPATRPRPPACSNRRDAGRPLAAELGPADPDRGLLRR
ncbi:hypothetical protein QFZ27_005594 [Inquilinus ginsengisoli]|uniref:DUF1272 domain-containing protein n=1 Tax=Inquilinus ginsengisoli TaxID=363840 RepID=UPI003D1A2C62